MPGPEWMFDDQEAPDSAGIDEINGAIGEASLQDDPSALGGDFMDQVSGVPDGFPEAAQDAINEATADAAGLGTIGPVADQIAVPGDVLEGPRDPLFGEYYMPPNPGDVVLDVLPHSIVTSDPDGRLVIEPDQTALAAHADRDAAANLISWVNSCGITREAIEYAIAEGSVRLERLMTEYDDVLESVGYDRESPEAVNCTAKIEALHHAVENAKEILAAL